MVRDLARLLRCLSSSIQAVASSTAVLPKPKTGQGDCPTQKTSYGSELILYPASRVELETWISCIAVWNGQTLLNPTPDLTIQTDASLQGWGACLGKLQCKGRWSLQEQSVHINHLKLLAVFYALKSLVSQKRDIHIRVQVQCRQHDSPVIINHKGGTHSH